MIPEAAVEAAASIRYEQDLCSPWDAADQETRMDWLEVTRPILEAAAPYMLAPVIELSDQLAASELAGDSYLIGRGSGFRIAGIRIRQVLGLSK